MKTFVTLMLAAVMTVTSVLPNFLADAYAAEIIPEDQELTDDELMAVDVEEEEPAGAVMEAEEAVEDDPEAAFQNVSVSATDEEDQDGTGDEFLGNGEEPEEVAEDQDVELGCPAFEESAEADRLSPTAECSGRHGGRSSCTETGLRSMRSGM